MLEKARAFLQIHPIHFFGPAIFGKQGVLDRFGQIEPKMIFVVDGYYYNGKAHDTIERVKGFLDNLPSIENIVMVEYIQTYQNIFTHMRIYPNLSRHILTYPIHIMYNRL